MTIFVGRVKGGFVVVHDWYQLSVSLQADDDEAKM